MPKGQYVRKKGKPSWRPAAKLQLIDKKPGFRYRWCEQDPDNLERKKAEGWVFAHELHGMDAEPEPGVDAAPVKGAKTHRELVLMALPEDMAKARAEYFEEQTKRQTTGTKELLEEQMRNNPKRKGASAHASGEIRIEDQSGKTIID